MSNRDGHVTVKIIQFDAGNNTSDILIKTRNGSRVEKGDRNVYGITNPNMPRWDKCWGFDLAEYLHGLE